MIILGKLPDLTQLNTKYYLHLPFCAFVWIESDITVSKEFSEIFKKYPTKNQSIT